MKKFLMLLLPLFLMSCGKETPKVVVLQPLGKFDRKSAESIAFEIRKINPTIVIRNNIDFPENSYYRPRNRYRADSIIKFLKDRIGSDSIVVGLTDKDISTTKGKHRDWGIMGLGYRPGNSCVVSRFRLDKKNRQEQFYKVVLHEIGHTQGLDHCPQKTCLMRDAEGGNPLNAETGFCIGCQDELTENGWKIPALNP